jgi:hypothetical protein
MKIAYLVFAYKNPQLLKREIERLSSEDSAFFVHIDQKSNIAEFSEITGENVFFTERRVRVQWAEFSGVEAILLLVRQALQSSQRYDYFVLLSGSEYPLRSASYIHAFLEANRGVEFIDLVKVPCEAAGKPLSRINTLRYSLDQPYLRFVMRALAKIGLAQRDYRKYLGNMAPYAGNTWWALTRDSCEWILQFVADNQCISDYFRNVFAPEESFFHTILGNSPFASRTRRNLVFEDWTLSGAHPATIGERHLALFESQLNVDVTGVYGSGEQLFARKLSDDNLKLLHRIEDMIRRKDELV